MEVGKIPDFRVATFFGMIFVSRGIRLKWCGKSVSYCHMCKWKLSKGTGWVCKCISIKHDTATAHTHWHRINELQRERLDFTGREMHSFFFGIPFMLHCKSIRLTFFCCGGEEEFRDCRHCWNLKHVYELCRVSGTSQIQIRCYQRWNSPSSCLYEWLEFNLLTKAPARP